MRILSLYLLKANNGNTRTICEICSGVLIVNFKQVSHIVLVFFTIHFEQRHVGWIRSRQYEKIPLREKCAKVFSGLYFPVLGLNMEIYGVNLRIQQAHEKIRTRKRSVLGHFSRSVLSHLYKNLDCLRFHFNTFTILVLLRRYLKIMIIKTL